MEQITQQVDELRGAVTRLDGDVRGLKTRVTSLEKGMEIIRDEQRRTTTEIRENTRLTEDIHGTVDDLASLAALSRWVSLSWRGAVFLAAGMGAFTGAALGALKLAHELGWLR